MLAALLAVAAAAATPPPERELEPGPHIAFIGEFVSLEEDDSDGSCESEEESRAEPSATAEGDGPTPLDVICIPNFNSVFEARYRVVARLAGDPHAPEVVFNVADHYGVPSFTQLRHALLVVTLREDHAYLQKYIGFGVYRVAGGGWATCGQDDSTAREAPKARPLTYLEPIRDLRGEDPRDVAAWRADPYLRIEGSKLYCARGVPVEEYLDYLRDGVLAARGVVLEPPPQVAKP
jgi:hypothetical protein